jgi:hypothetical protein
MPKDLVDHIDVDLSLLKNFDDNIKISDIVVDKTITILTPTSEVVAIASKPRDEVVSNNAPESEIPEEEDGKESEEKSEEK